MLHPTLVINVVGLTPNLIGAHTPNINALAHGGAMRPLNTVTPAVTCTVQATFTTGSLPRNHGAVGNGWLFRDLMEVWLWRQSNKLLHGEHVWDLAKQRDPMFTSANLFWWYAMASTVDYTITPRPIYKADGRKIPDCYSDPPQLRDELTKKLGAFPLFQFWGPATTIASSQWIADAAKYVLEDYDPTLTLVYLPHLDYGLQRFGPDHPNIVKDVREIDMVVGDLAAEGRRLGRRIIVLSEYGIVPVSRPIFINRALREAALVAIREEQGREHLDVPRCRAFAVADHQLAHVYVAEASDMEAVRGVLASLDGVETVLDEQGKKQYGLDHPRSGELIAIAKPDSWFAYYYWLDDARAPDFARTVEIHRKPGYDPVELFVDPSLRFPKLAIGWRLLKKALGFRTLMDVIPLDATLVKGSHGRPDTSPEYGPIFISSEPELAPAGVVEAPNVKELILRHIFERTSGGR